MPETSLTIRTRMVGNASRQVNSLRDSLGGLQDYATRARSNISGFVDSIFSLQSAVVGFATYGAGKSMWDMMIGSNAELESQKTTFRTILGDVDKANSLISDLEEFSARTPFQQSNLIEGSRRLLSLTEGNVDRNKELVEVASQLAAVSGPEQGVVQAAEALRDASVGEFERLKEFGIKLSKDEIDQTRESGETLGQAAMRGVRRELEGLTGGRDVVDALSQTFEGKKSTLKDRFSKLMRDMGEPAFEEIKLGLDDALDEIERLRADPEFQREAEQFAQWMGDTAESVAEFAPTLIGEIPDAMQSVEETFETVTGFYNRHSGLIKTVAAAWAGNKLLGGAPMDLAKFGIGRALGGGGGGGLVGGAGGMVGADGNCCEGIGDAADTLDDVASAGASRGWLQKALFTSGSTSAAASFTEGTLAAITPSAIGSLVAGVAPFAVGALGLQQFSSAKKGPGKRVENPIEAGDFGSNALAAIESGDKRRAKKLLMQGIGAGSMSDRFRPSEGDQRALESVNAALASKGLTVDIEKGEKIRNLSLKASGGFEDRSALPFTHGAATQDDKARAAEVGRVEVGTLKLEMKASGNSKKDARKAGREAMKGLKEEARKTKAKE